MGIIITVEQIKDGMVAAEPVINNFGFEPIISKLGNGKIICPPPFKKTSSRFNISLLKCHGNTNR